MTALAWLFTSRYGQALLAALVLAAAVWWAYDAVTDAAYDRGYAARALECREAAADAAADAEAIRRWNDITAAAATTELQAGLAETLPAIEESAHAATERIRIEYRDRPAAGCARPDGVRVELEAARERANAAARGLRSGAGGTDTADS